MKLSAPPGFLGEAPAGAFLAEACVGAVGLDDAVEQRAVAGGEQDRVSVPQRAQIRDQGGEFVGGFKQQKASAWAERGSKLVRAPCEFQIAQPFAAIGNHGQGFTVALEARGEGVYGSTRGGCFIKTQTRNPSLD